MPCITCATKDAYSKTKGLHSIAAICVGVSLQKPTRLNAFTAYFQPGVRGQRGMVKGRYGLDRSEERDERVYAGRTAGGGRHYGSVSQPVAASVELGEGARQALSVY
jgi:hypothetical protein